MKKKFLFFALLAGLLCLTAISVFATQITVSVPYTTGQTLVSVYDTNGRMCAIYSTDEAEITINIPEGATIKWYNLESKNILTPVKDSVALETDCGDYSYRKGRLTFSGEHAFVPGGNFHQNPWFLLAPAVDTVYILDVVAKVDVNLLAKMNLKNCYYEGTEAQFTKIAGHGLDIGGGVKVLANVTDPDNPTNEELPDTPVTPPKPVSYCLVVWQFADGTSTTQKVKKTSVVTYSGAEPKKEKQGSTYYAFHGWRGEDGNLYRAKKDDATDTTLYKVGLADAINTDYPLKAYQNMTLTAEFVTWDGDDSWGDLH